MLLGAWNAGKVFALTQQVSLLLNFDVIPDPRLLLLIAGVWMALFWGAAIALWRRQRFTHWLIPLLLLLYALYELILLGFFVRMPEGTQSWLARILLYDLAILFAIWSLNRSESRSYLKGARPGVVNENRESGT
jgi:peptidoglycan/LPS O-acetylase OafA/YrhL